MRLAVMARSAAANQYSSALVENEQLARTVSQQDGHFRAIGCCNIDHVAAF